MDSCLIYNLYMTKNQKILLLILSFLILLLASAAIFIFSKLNDQAISKTNIESGITIPQVKESPQGNDDQPKKISLTFAPNISSNCRKKTAPQPKWFEETEGDCTNLGSYGPWIFSGTVEDKEFSGDGVAYWSKINGYSYNFNKLENNNYEIQLSLDKINFEQNVEKDSYTAFGLNDWFLKEPVTLESDSYLTFEIKVNKFEKLKATDKNRVSVGFVAEDKTSRRYYFEFNLLKTPSFDLCTDSNLGGYGVSLPCDTVGYIDRRSAGDLYKFDIVYYDYSGIAQSEQFKEDFNKYYPINLNSFTKVTIPYTRIFEKTDWAKNQDLSQLTLLGTYIGTEIYGEGASSITIKDYDLYKVL